MSKLVKNEEGGGDESSTVPPEIISVKKESKTGANKRKIGAPNKEPNVERKKRKIEPPKLPPGTKPRTVHVGDVYTTNNENVVIIVITGLQRLKSPFSNGHLYAATILQGMLLNPEGNAYDDEITIGTEELWQPNKWKLVKKW
jgi:hypothetical protein